MLFLFGLGRLPLLGPDEPRYVEIAREMFVTGDWITPRLAGILWFEKPALLYWLAASSFYIFGISELSARLGVTLVASIGVAANFLFARRVGLGSSAAVSALMLASMGLWIAFGRGATFDMPLAVAIQLSLLTFWCWAERESGGGWLLLACAFFVGLAVLAKGLVGILLPGAITFSYLVLTRRLKLLVKNPGLLLAAIIVFLATAGVWYGPMLSRHGWHFVDEFFVAHHFRRYLSDKFRHPQPFYFFAVVALVGSFPWTAYLASAILRDVRRVQSLFKEPGLKLRVFLWMWILIPVVFFSFSGSKLPGYVLPIFPAIALMAGLEASEGARSVWRICATTALMVTAAVAFAVAAPRQLAIGASAAWSIASLGLLAAFAYTIVASKQSERRGIVTLTCGVALIVVTTLWQVSPGLARRDSIRDLAEIALQKARPQERLIFYLDNDQGVNFYATDLPLRDPHSELITIQHGDEVVPLLEQWNSDSMLVMCYERWSAGLFMNGRFGTEKLATHERRIACSPACDWVLLRVSRKDAANAQR